MTGIIQAPTAKTYTRAIADAHDTHGRYAALLDDIKLIGRTKVPAGWLPWLVRDAGLERLMPYVDWAVLLEKGPAWLRIRGTPAATVEALGWVGWHVRFECGAAGTDLYDHYHVHLPAVPSLEEMERIVGVERVAKSTDSTFFRVTHGYDHRKVRSGHTRMGQHIFGRDSGVDLRSDWPRLSFRFAETVRIDLGAGARASETLTVGTRAVRVGDIILSRSRLPERSKLASVLGLALGDSTRVTGSITVTAHDRLRPLAGVVGGRTRIGARQGLFIALQHERGTRPLLGHARSAGAFRLPLVRQLMAVPDPIVVADRFAVSPTVHVEDVLGIATRTGDRRPLAGHPGDAGTRAHMEVTAFGSVQISARVSLDDAAWSVLPWGDEPWGAAPTGQIFAVAEGED